MTGSVSIDWPDFDWPSTAWDEIGTGLVTGAITGLVAVGLFLLQRRSDRRDARDLRTMEAIEAIRRETFALVDAVRAEARSAKRDRPSHKRWRDEVSVHRAKVDDSNAVALITEAQQVTTSYAQRRREIARVHARVADSYPREGMVQRRLLAGDLSNYLTTLSDHLSTWRPNVRIPVTANPAARLLTPYQPSTPIRAQLPEAGSTHKAFATWVAVTAIGATGVAVIVKRVSERAKPAKHSPTRQTRG